MAAKQERPQPKKVSKGYTVEADTNVTEQASGAFVEAKMLKHGRAVIEDRAIPDFRDGHKPVHRRLIYSAWDLQGSPTGSFLKVARVTGDTSGRFHPHGSAADSLVSLTYSRYPMFVGQGNFGSIKGDEAAAERYIECRVSPLIKPHFACADVMTTMKNYSGEFQEPLVINTRLPLLFLNGGEGVAPGITTRMPSHNLSEICQVLEYVARNWKTASMDGVLEIVKGPDFVFGGVMLSGKDELRTLYSDGVGKLRFSCDYKVEPHPSIPNVTNVVVHGFPDPFNIGSFIDGTISEFKRARVIVGYTEHYNKKTQEFRMVVSVDNPASLKKVLASLQCSVTYRYNVVERLGENEGDVKFYEAVPFLVLARKWLLWRKEEEEKMLRLDLQKLAASKFKEECKLTAMLNISILAAAVDQTKTDPHEYVVKALKVSREVAEELLKFRLIDLRRLDEGKLRKSIKDIETEIAKTNKFLQQPMAVVVKHLQEIASTYGDARRTRVNARMHDERKMQHAGDPLAFAVTADGKLMGVVDEKGTTASALHVSPSYEGQAVFGSAGVVGFFGASDTGKAGIGFDTVVGTAPREAPLLFCIGSNGCYNLAEQSRDSNKAIPTFIKDTGIIFGAGVWPDSKVMLWGSGKSRMVKISDLKCMRKNVKGIKLPGTVSHALVVHPWQSILDNEGNAVSSRSAPEQPDGLFVLGERNLVVFRSGRRKIMDKKQTVAAFARGDVASVHDLTLPKET